jgi:hypothetical protein
MADRRGGILWIDTRHPDFALRDWRQSHSDCRQRTGIGHRFLPPNRSECPALKNSAWPSRHVEPGGITTTITALIPGRRNRPVSGRNAGQCGGDDASQPALRPGIPAHRLRRVRRGAVTYRQPGIHRGRSTTALYGGRDAALLRGNPGRRAHYRLHAQAAGEPQRGLPQRFRQARTIGSGEIGAGRRQRHRLRRRQVSCDMTCSRLKIGSTRQADPVSTAGADADTPMMTAIGPLTGDLSLF